VPTAKGALRAKRLAARSRRATADLLAPVPPATVTKETTAGRRTWARLRGAERIPGLRTMKVALATVLAYVVADVIMDAGPPVVAALTALLVVQANPYQAVKSGWQRIGSVVAGVLVAVLLLGVVGLTWWSLGITVLAGLVVAHVLHLGPHSVEVPISAMLVLTVGSQTDAGVARVYETLIGAGIGVLVSLVAPRTYVQPAGDAIGDLAAQISSLLREVAADVEEAWTRERVDVALQKARQLEAAVVQARSALARAEESLLLNPRGRNAAHVPHALRSALTALEYSAINVRVVCRSLVDRVDGVPPQELPPPRVARPLARLLDAAADAVAAFGAVVATDVAGPTPNDGELRHALRRAASRRNAASAALAVDPRRQPDIWRVHGALLAHIDRLLTEIDPDAEIAAGAVKRARPARPSHQPLRRTFKSIMQ
jgi:hypothetical protein